MPIEHDWPDQEPMTEEDAVKRVVKRMDKLSKGITGELWKMHQNCHKEALEKGNPEHLPPDSPMVFIRDRSDPEKPELFHICRSCFSAWYVKRKPSVREKVDVLRGTLTKEAQEQLLAEREADFAKRTRRKSSE